MKESQIQISFKFQNKSSGSSNVSSPPTNESEDEGYSANESQRMFLIIEMLEKYLKLSSDAEPLNDLDDVKESGSSATEYDSSAVTSPDNLSPPAYKTTHQTSPINSNTTTTTTNDMDQQKYSDRKYAFQSSAAGRNAMKLSGKTAFSTSVDSSYPSMNLCRAIGSQHTSLLLENLRNYGRSNRSSLLSSMNFTPAVLEDKQLLRRIRDELKQQQLDIILNRHNNNRRPYTSDTNNLRQSTSLYMLPIPQRNPTNDRKDVFTYKLSGVPTASMDQSLNDQANNNSAASRVPLISIKYASQEKPTINNTDGTQTDPIPVNDIYHLYHEYLKQQEKEKQLQQQQQQSLKNSNLLSKSMSVGCKIGDATTKHSKRKSSIDNEDISQSVSDTIKRYLRMARKKPTNENDANRFKRINYDTNLRNITPKAEIPKPDELDIGNTKHTQTNDDWCEIVIKNIKIQMSNKDHKYFPLSDCPEEYQHQTYPTDRKTMSSSTPTSPTGFFHSSMKIINRHTLQVLTKR